MTPPVTMQEPFWSREAGRAVQEEPELFVAKNPFSSPAKGCLPFFQLFHQWAEYWSLLWLQCSPTSPFRRGTPLQETQRSSLAKPRSPNTKPLSRGFPLSNVDNIIQRLHGSRSMLGRGGSLLSSLYVSKKQRWTKGHKVGMELRNAGRVTLHGMAVLKRSTKCTADKYPLKLVCISLNNPLSKLDYKRAVLTYRLTSGVVILELIARCAAAQAMLLGRALPAEMFTASIIHGTVAVFDLWEKQTARETWRWEVRVTER